MAGVVVGIGVWRSDQPTVPFRRVQKAGDICPGHPGCASSMDNKTFNPAGAVDAPIASQSRILHSGRRPTDQHRYARNTCAILLATCLLTALPSAHAHPFEYPVARKRIAEHCPSSGVLPEKAVFIGRWQSPEFARIIEFKKGILLRDIIDQTPVKNRPVTVCVMRSVHLKSGRIITEKHWLSASPLDKPVYGIRANDIIWLYDKGPILET